MVKVSVLVPVYNVKRYLRQCLDSLAAQTLDDIEFVCIDDGSTDGCSEILDAYAVTDERFHVIHKANSGYGASMNVGLREAQGEYVGIVESDDFADAEMFSTLYQISKTHHAEVVKSNYFIFTGQDGNTFHEMLAGLPYHTMCSAKEERRLLQTDTFLWTSLYQRFFLLQNEIWFHETPGASYQDVSFSLKVALCCKRMYLVPEGYLHYRMDNLGASGHQVSKKYLCYHDEMAEYWRFLKKRSQEEQEIGTAAAYNAWRIYQTSCWPYVAHKDKLPYLRRVMEEFRSLQLQGRLKQDEWPADAWKNLQDLLYHPKERLFACAEDMQRQEMLRQGFIEQVKRTSLYIYGAGTVAKNLINQLHQYDIRPAGIFVNQLKGNPSEITGIPVHAIVSSQVDRDHDLILIATTPRKPDVQQGIFFALDEAGYRNVMVLTAELQQALSWA